jgi:hypothetical protein
MVRSIIILTLIKRALGFVGPKWLGTDLTIMVNNDLTGKLPEKV